MRLKTWSLVLSIVLTLFGTTLGKRNSRKGSSGSAGKLEEWQKKYLEKIQLLAKDSGLPEEDWKDITKFDKDVCYDNACLQSAIEILQASNFTVDPCEKDMWYEFACAKRVNGADNLNQPERLSYKVVRQTKHILDVGIPATKKTKLQDFLLKEAQVYYQQCKNSRRHDKADVKDIFAYLSENYGEWPMLSNRDPGEKFNWMSMVADLNRIERVGFQPFLLQVEVTQSTPSILLGVGKTSTSITASDFNKMMTRVQERITKKRPARLDQLQKMSQFIGTVGSVALKQGQQQIMTVKQLQRNTDQYMKQRDIQKMSMKWVDFLKRALAGSQVTVTEDTPIVVDNRTLSVLEVATRYTTSEPQAIANTLHFQFASLLLQESTMLLDDLNSFKCNEQAGSKEDICYARTTEIFGYSLGKTYLSVFYNDSVETPAIKDLMSKIQRGYVDSIVSYDWMENSTKAYLIDKINAMTTFIAQPEWTKDPKKMMQFYKALNASTDVKSPYPRNFIAVTEWQVGKKRAWNHKLSKITSFQQINIYDTEWSRYLGTVNAQFHKVLNDARIEGGIVQSPLFSANRPGFMNFGGLGMVLGHEIGHSFDTQGRKYDKTGSDRVEHWDKVSLERYNKWVQNILDDYSSEAHQVSETSAETIDSSKTLNEDIADILGVYISHWSYQEFLKDLKSAGKKEKVLPGLKSFSPEKLFYMKYTNMWCDKKDVQSNFNDLLQVHSPGNIRATMPIKRSKQWAETFDCPLPEEFQYK